jgi:myo-inositol-1(or 4)-monophosphatase
VPDPDTELLVAALHDAGVIARRYFNGTFKTFRKEAGDPVTEADLEIDAYLKERLHAARPDYGWLSEESEDDLSRLSASRTFVVDPIDGTYGFVKRRPHFTIVAAVVENGRPVSAAIYNPISDEMYEAAKGDGARKNGKPVEISSYGELAGARFLAARSLLDSAHGDAPWPEGITTESRASIAYRMALIAEGAFDAMISLSQKSDWDLAAGDLIVHEAGGCVTTAEGETLIYNRRTPPRQGSVICAPPELHRRLVERLKGHAAPRTSD